MKIGDSVKVKDGIKEPDNEDFEIQQSEIDGLDWKTMVLLESDLSKTESRDKEGDVTKMQKLFPMTNLSI